MYQRAAIAIPLDNYSINSRISKTEKKDWIDHSHPLIVHTLKKTALYEYFIECPDKQLFIDTNLPLGIGIGGSSALVASLIKLEEKVTLRTRSFKESLELAMVCEDLAHGRSSGLDVAVALLQKPMSYRAGQVEDIAPGFEQSLMLVNTGASNCSTRNCVTQVAKNFGAYHKIWDDFEDIYNAIVQDGITHEAIKENHILLKKIGVVPDPVCQFISSIEKEGGAAKISGAGNIHASSHNAGVIIATGIDQNNLSDIGSAYGYSFLPG